MIGADRLVRADSQAERFRRADDTPPERKEPRVRKRMHVVRVRQRALPIGPLRSDGEIGPRRNFQFRAQAVKRQALDQIGSPIARAVEQNSVVTGLDEQKIE